MRDDDDDDDDDDDNTSDFEKPFDTPTHELLKSKLFSYGIGGKTLNVGWKRLKVYYHEISMGKFSRVAKMLFLC